MYNRGIRGCLPKRQKKNGDPPVQKNARPKNVKPDANCKTWKQSAQLFQRMTEPPKLRNEPKNHGYRVQRRIATAATNHPVGR